MKHVLVILFLSLTGIRSTQADTLHVKASGGGYGESEARKFAKKHATETANKLCINSPLNYRGRRFDIVRGSMQLTSNCTYSIPYGDCIAVAGVEFDIQCRDEHAGFWF